GPVANCCGASDHHRHASILGLFVRFAGDDLRSSRIQRPDRTRRPDRRGGTPGGAATSAARGAAPGGGPAGPGPPGWGTGARGVDDVTLAGLPPKTCTGSPRCTRSWKYSAMCIGMRTQPCDAGVVGTESYPCTAMPLLK